VPAQSGVLGGTHYKGGGAPLRGCYRPCSARFHSSTQAGRFFTTASVSRGSSRSKFTRLARSGLSVAVVFVGMSRARGANFSCTSFLRASLTNASAAARFFVPLTTLQTVKMGYTPSWGTAMATGVPPFSSWFTHTLENGASHTCPCWVSVLSWVVDV